MEYSFCVRRRLGSTVASRRHVDGSAHHSGSHIGARDEQRGKPAMAPVGTGRSHKRIHPERRQQCSNSSCPDLARGYFNSVKSSRYLQATEAFSASSPFRSRPETSPSIPRGCQIFSSKYSDNLPPRSLSRICANNWHWHRDNQRVPGGCFRLRLVNPFPEGGSP